MLSTVEFVKRMLDVAAERGESAVVKFEVRPRICSQQCRGFHKSNYFRFNPDGTVEFQDSPIRVSLGRLSASQFPCGRF
jgi:hypothetical protein